MSLATEFNERLDRLWKRRTASLRDALFPHGRGKLPSFNKQVRQRYVNELLDLASEILNRDAKWYLSEVVVDRKLVHLRGWGNRQRGGRLVNWVADKLEGPIVYSFWKGNRCLYVGKGKKPNRLYSYERHLYMREADCVQALFIRSRSYLPQAECLATHLYEPRDNRVQAARVRWGKKCPICKQHDFVKTQLEELFRMRR